MYEHLKCICASKKLLNRHVTDCHYLNNYLCAETKHK